MAWSTKRCNQGVWGDPRKLAMLRSWSRYFVIRQNIRHQIRVNSSNVQHILDYFWIFKDIRAQNKPFPKIKKLEFNKFSRAAPTMVVPPTISPLANVNQLLIPMRISVLIDEAVSKTKIEYTGMERFGSKIVLNLTYSASQSGQNKFRWKLAPYPDKRVGIFIMKVDQISFPSKILDGLTPLT